MHDPKTRYQQVRSVTLLGAVTNIILGIAKIIFGILGKSQALIADGIHSLSDLVTDVLVLVAARYGSRAADEDHPYGHERIETLATVFLAVLLLLVAGGIIYDAIRHLMSTAEITPSVYVLLVALISIFAKEALYQYTKYIAGKINSELLRANAWHHRSDAASSVVVLLGIIGALLGFPYLDDVAAIVVGLLIIKMSWDLGWPSARQLVDTAVPLQQSQQIADVITQVSGVYATHQLRTRLMGSNILVDVHVLIDPKLSVSEGHYIAHQVQLALKKQFTMITDVTVHIDPEDDEQAVPSIQLPSRDVLLARLEQVWRDLPGFTQHHGITLHYLAGKISIELSLPATLLQAEANAAEITAQYQQTLKTFDDVAEVTVKFSTSAPIHSILEKK